MAEMSAAATPMTMSAMGAGGGDNGGGGKAAVVKARAAATAMVVVVAAVVRARAAATAMMRAVVRTSPQLLARQAVVLVRPPLAAVRRQAMRSLKSMSAAGSSLPDRRSSDLSRRGLNVATRLSSLASNRHVHGRARSGRGSVGARVGARVGAPARAARATAGSISVETWIPTAPASAHAFTCRWSSREPC